MHVCKNIRSLKTKLRISLISKELCSGSIKSVWFLHRIAQINSIASGTQAGTNFHLFLKLTNHSSLFISIVSSVELAHEVVISVFKYL